MILNGLEEQKPYGKCNIEVEIISRAWRYQWKKNINLEEFDDEQVKQIQLGLEEGLDVSIYTTVEFNWKQMEQIRIGLESGLDVSIYAKPEFDYIQMYQIREGLKDGLDVSIYARPEFDWMQMERIRKRVDR